MVKRFFDWIFGYKFVKPVKLDSPIEEMFWKEAKHRIDNLEAGYEVRLFPNIKYRLDFAIPEYKIGIELDGHNTGGLCGFFYHDIFPYIIMLQFGGSFPAEWGGDPDVVELECPDRTNVVKIELKRVRDNV